MEKIINNLRAIASLLVYMTYAEDNVQDREYALGFLSKQLSDCAEELAKRENEKS